MRSRTPRSPGPPMNLAAGAVRREAMEVRVVAVLDQPAARQVAARPRRRILARAQQSRRDVEARAWSCRPRPGRRAGSRAASAPATIAPTAWRRGRLAPGDAIAVHAPRRRRSRLGAGSRRGRGSARLPRRAPRGSVAAWPRPVVAVGRPPAGLARRAATPLRSRIRGRTLVSAVGPASCVARGLLGRRRRAVARSATASVGDRFRYGGCRRACASTPLARRGDLGGCLGARSRRARRAVAASVVAASAVTREPLPGRGGRG